jgi:mannose-6-phosphate isomerase-like protein (cupin superfamily)
MTTSPTGRPSTAAEFERDLRALGERPGDQALLDRAAGHGLAVLPALGDHLASDLPIAVLEAYESVLKAVLRRAMNGEVPPEAARAIAALQQRVGLLRKYKSYAVKASSPLGYSIFLQNPGEGFSFQRHLTHKTEVFHILDVHPGGFVFLCTADEWMAAYDRDRFAAWLAGERDDPAYERFRIAARPGDVFVLDELGIVHTVIGCTLEEFATISTDMVDRLHDQNAGRPIPAAFNRAFVEERLPTLRTPPASRLVRPAAPAGGEAAGGAGERTVPGPRQGDAGDRGAVAGGGGRAGARIDDIPTVPAAGGHRTVLADGFVVATLIQVEPRAETEVQHDPARAASLYVRRGKGRILLGSAAELARATPPSLPLRTGDLLTLAPGLRYAFVNEGGEALDLVEHRIRPEVAFY